MSQSNPPDLQRRQRQDLPPTFDEWIAIILAIATMGFVFFWTFGKVDPKLSLGLFQASPTETAGGDSSIRISDLVEDTFSAQNFDLFQGTDRDARTPISNGSRTAFSAPSKSVVPTLPLFAAGSPPETITRAALVPKSSEGLPEQTSAVPLVPLESPPNAETPSPSETEMTDEAAIATPDSPDTPSDGATSETPQETEIETTDETAIATPDSPDTPSEVAISKTPKETETATPPASETETTDETAIATPDSPSDTATSETPSETETATSPPATDTPDATNPLLSNVPEGHWARGFVMYFVNQNQAIGLEDNTFEPDEPITRGQFANQLQQAFEREDIEPDINFQDLSEDYWANPAIRDVTKRGFLKGYPGEVFRPEQRMTQVEVVVALVSGLDLTPPKNPQEVLEVYGDADQIPEWAVDKVAAATEAGLVVNYPEQNIFAPDRPVSQAEAIAMIYQGLVRSGNVEPIESEYIVDP